MKSSNFLQTILEKLTKILFLLSGQSEFLDCLSERMKNLKKMSLNLATKELSRKELKGIMAGSGNSGGGGCPWGCREWEICCGSYNGPTWCQNRPCGY